MASEWTACTLGDVVNLKRGYDLPQSRRRPGSFPIISSSGTSDFHAAAKVAGPGVVTGRYGTIGKVHFEQGSFWPLNTTLYVENFRGNDPRFIYYLLHTIRYGDYLDKAAVPGVNRNDVHRAKVVLPPIDEQRGIAKLLTSLDDRADQLSALSHTAENVARTIFKSWFVDFDPVRAKAEGLEPEGMDAATAALFADFFHVCDEEAVPAGFAWLKLGEVLDVLETGGRPKGGVSGILNGVPSVGAESIASIGRFDFGKTKFVSREFFDGMKKGRCEDGDVLLYKDGGRPGMFIPHVTMFGEEFPFSEYAINEHVYRLRARAPITQAFLYFWLTSDRADAEMRNRGTGVAIPGLNSTAVKELPILVASEAIHAAFDNLASPLCRAILVKSKLAQALAELRDALLPRLISGKLRIPEAEKLVEAAL